MTADTRRLVEKLCDFIRVDSVTHEVRHYMFTPAQIEALAAALQGRALEGEPSDAVTPEMFKAASPWLTNWQFLNRATRESNFEEAYKAARRAAVAQALGGRCE